MEALDILANDEHGVVLTWRGASVMARLWIIALSYDGNLKRGKLAAGDSKQPPQRNAGSVGHAAGRPPVRRCGDLAPARSPPLRY
jgi:hypothetical protein